MVASIYEKIELEDNKNEKTRVAVIGTGMAGLCAAWLLSTSGEHCITLYDKQSEAGLGAHSRVINDVVVDVPLRIVTQSFYPELIALYKHLEIKLYVADSSSTLAWRPETENTAESLGKPYFRYSNNIRGTASSSQFDTKSCRQASSYRIIWELVWLCIIGSLDYYRGVLKDSTIGDYLEKKKYSPAFVNGFLIAYLSVICTCSHTSALAYPAEVVFEYFLPATLSSNGVYRVSEGVRSAIAALTVNIKSFFYNSNVTKLERLANGKWAIHDNLNGENSYDHVIIATDAHPAASILSEINPKLSKLLKTIKVERSETVVHTDESFMPVDRSLWSSMNLQTTTRTADNESEVTAWINSLQPMTDQRDVFQTWNPSKQPREETVISRSFFDRPVVTLETENVLHELAQVQGQDNIWVCGAYSVSGVPLLENAAKSGFMVAERIGAVERPWKSTLQTPVPHATQAAFAVAKRLGYNVVVNTVSMFEDLFIYAMSLYSLANVKAFKLV
eukprot:CFRG2920T1